MLTKLRSFVYKLFHQTKQVSQKIAVQKIEIKKHDIICSTVRLYEYDALKMKTIVLLKEKGMCGTPFHKLLNEPPQVKIGSEQNRVIISQIFEWSEKKYQVEGEFLRDAKRSIPLPKTFKITQSLMQ